MISVPVYEAKTRLSELLLRVQQGEAITITRHGSPAARLVAVDTAAPGAAARSQGEAVDAVLQALTALREGVILPVPLQEAIGHGRD